MAYKQTYQLDPFEMQFVVMAAERRNVGKQPNGVVDRKHATRFDDFSVNLIGMMGEYAVARSLGIKVDTEISLKGDGGAVDLDYKGVTIQVKTTATTGQLIFDSLAHFKADVAIGCKIIAPNKVKICGWVTQDVFYQNHYTTDYGFGPRKVMDLDSLFQLNEISSFKEFLNNGSKLKAFAAEE